MTDTTIITNFGEQKPLKLSETWRRRVMATAGAAITAALLAKGIAIMPSNPDADLIAACGEAEALGTAYHQAFDGLDFDEAKRIADPWADRVLELQGVIVDHKAMTLAGLVARAKALLAYGGESFADPDDELHGWEESVSASIVRDLLAIGGQV